MIGTVKLKLKQVLTWEFVLYDISVMHILYPCCYICKVVQNLLKKTELSEEEQQQLVAKYMEEAEEMKQRHNDLQRHSRAVLAAKLAARRRQKEEMNKEAAMKKELKEMSRKQVAKFICQGENVLCSYVCLLAIVSG